jgi:DNA-binding MarR family transcriptional regulator
MKFHSRLSSPEQAQLRRQFIQSISPDIDPEIMQLMEGVRQVAHALAQIGETSLEASGLSYAQYRVLLSLSMSEAIQGRDELNPSEISEIQGTSRNTISALIRSLEENGLVERRLDQQDRRRFNISLTEAGQDLLKQHARQHFEMIGNCFTSLDETERDNLRLIMLKLDQHIQVERDRILRKSSSHR